MNPQSIDHEAYLEHYGVKGMKWGVRKERDDGDRKRQFITKENAKKAAYGTGALLVAAGAAYVAVKLHQNGSVRMSDLPSSPATELGKKVMPDLMEPTTYIHASRGKNTGYRFFQEGNVPTYLEEYESAFGPDRRLVSGDSYFGKFGKNDEKIAAVFPDPEGRKDFAGRPITHDVIIPKGMSDGISNIDDVVKKVWPKIKDTYDPK